MDIGFQLTNAFFAVGRLHVLRFALDNDVSVLLFMLGTFREDDEVRARLFASKLQRKRDGDVAFCVAVFTNQRFRYLLANVLLWRFIPLSGAIDEVEQLSLLHDHCRNFGI